MAALCVALDDRRSTLLVTRWTMDPSLVAGVSGFWDPTRMPRAGLSGARPHCSAERDAAWEWGCGVVGRGRADEIRASVFTNDVTPAVRRISAQ